MTVLGGIMNVLGIVTVLGVIVTVLVRVDGEFRRRHARAQHLLRVHVRVAECEPAERGSQISKRQAGVDERAKRHVARQAREAIEVRHSHSCPSSLKLQYRASPSTM